MNERKIQRVEKLSAWSAGKRDNAKRDQAALSSLTMRTGFLPLTAGRVACENRDATSGRVFVCF